MARQRRGLGVGVMTSIGCSLLVAGCCMTSIIANVCTGAPSAVSPPSITTPVAAPSQPPAVPILPPAAPIPAAPPPVLPRAPAVPATAPTAAAAADDVETARVALFARARGRGSMAVRREDLGDEWPLTVARGTLRCTGSARLGAVTFEAPNGRVYAVNGTARSRPGTREIDPIWAPSRDPILRDMGGRVSIGTLIALGLALCGS